MSVTIRDVARVAGVSVATVSRVLSGSRAAADGTAARVIEAARALRYVPHAAAQSLSSRRTGAVGVILPDLHGEFFSELLRGVDRAVQARGRHVLVSSSHHDARGVGDAVRAMRGRVDGLLVMSPDLDAAALAEHLPGGLPIVLVNCEAPGADVDVLRVDNFGGARAMTAHLVALGHRRVATVAGARHNLDAQERLRGYQAALADAGLAAPAEYVLGGDFSEAGGHAAALALMALAEPPTAVFCANDAIAVGALSALRELGVDVPGRVAIAGFDDVPIARYVSPPLTTVRVHIERLGARAADVLLGALPAPGAATRAPGAADGAGPRVRETVGTELVIRASCGAGRPPPDHAR